MLGYIFTNQNHRGAGFWEWVEDNVLGPFCNKVSTKKSIS